MNQMILINLQFQQSELIISELGKIQKYYTFDKIREQSNRKRPAMRNKKNINFKEQIENSQKFLSKLQTLKKASKDIKQKNKLTQHRNLWVKEFNYLSRLQRDMDLQLINYFDTFDRYFQYEIQERQIFGANNYKNYSQLKQHIQQNFQRFQAQTLKQVQSLPLLAEKCHKASFKEIKKTQVLQILADIEQVLNNVQRENCELEMQLTKQQEFEERIQQQNLDQFEQDNGNFSSLKQISSSIRGFDMEKQKIIKLRESEQNLIHYLDCFNDKLNQDEIYEVINQFNHANRLLQETHQLQQQKIHLDYEQPLKLNSQILQNSQNFSKISHIYSTYIGRGKSVQLYFQRLAIEFPKMNRKNLDTITAYIQAKIYKDKKLKALKRNYYREKEELFAKVDKEIHLRIQIKIQKNKKKAQLLERKQEKLKLDNELQILRAQYQQKQQQKLKIIQQQQAALKQAQRKKQALRKLYLDQLNKKADQVQQIKTQKEIKQQKAIESKRIKQQEEKRKKILQNKPKVQIRQSIERKKIQQKVVQRQIRAKIPEMQAQRIKHAIENYNFRPKVQFSQERLNQPTEAMVKRKETVMDMADKVQLSKMTGYSVNQLMSDMRFKVNMALQQAGLSNTDYARQMLVSMSKRPG